MINGAIFDMDGVLLDNLDYHLSAFKIFGQEQGKVLTDVQIQAVFGRKNADMLQVLLERRLSETEVRRYEARKEQLYRELILPQLQERVVPGLFDFIADLRTAGFAVALATSGPLDNVDMVLDGLALRPSFDAIITADQVRHGKPHPETFLRAATELGVRTPNCVVFEDSFSGVKAALSAGCKCIALATTHTRNELMEVHAHRIIQDFSELRVRDLQDL